MSSNASKLLVSPSGRSAALAALGMRGGSRPPLADERAIRALYEFSHRRRESRPLIRMVHHMACTGGTLIARSLNAQPNALVLSEVDPLSTIQLKTMRSRFAPTDPILMARVGLFPISDADAVEMFRSSVDVLRQRLERQGRRLILRSHPHSQFCTDQDWNARPTLRDMYAGLCETLSIVTVRHPLDSWLSLVANGWNHFSPFNIDEYARRYLAFLDSYSDIAMFKYETFVSDPDEEMRRICDHLSLTYNSDWRLLISAFKLSGDSGRKGDAIMLRPRRETPDAVLEEAGASPRFVDLCDRLGYEQS